MIIRLTNDQIALFWDLIKDGLISSNKIPEEFQQDYAIYTLGKLYSGKYQAWICYRMINGEKQMVANIVTSIVDRNFYGIKSLSIESIYGQRFITEEDINEMISMGEEFAKSNGCKMMSTIASLHRVKELLNIAGFKESHAVYRKFIGE